LVIAIDFYDTIKAVPMGEAMFALLCFTAGSGAIPQIRGHVNGFALVNKGSMIHLAAFAEEPVRKPCSSRTAPGTEM